MSSIVRRIAKRAKKQQLLQECKASRQQTKSAYKPPKRYTSFNIFTSDGKNLTVTSKKPMTLEEAQYYYKALSISGND